MSVRVGSIRAMVGALGLSLLLSSSALAQSIPPGGVAPVPILPPSSVPPPNTVPPTTIGNNPTTAVSFSYFGPSAIVLQVAIPIIVTSTSTVGCYSGPNATQTESDQSIKFGDKPAGSQFILYFLRGTRSYTFDVSFGNYCWVDNNYVRS